KANEIPVVDYVWFYRNAWKRHREDVIKDIEERLVYPMFVKPANLGSSIGINKAKDKTGLIESIEVAIQFDRKVIIEQAVENPREINCAVLGIDDHVEASYCEEPLGWKEVLTFADKYFTGGKKGPSKVGSKGTGNSARDIPAKISDEMRDEIERLAIQSFMAIDAAGTARIDFLIDSEGKILVNEINTLPGSLGYYLWTGKGIDFKDLITRVLDMAFDRHREIEENLCVHDVDLYSNTGYGSKLS
ncbi:MAG: D-alanine--D-alanine ligase, partial [Tissierellia bacterium]|nr:D-alanine--D-alanine ligase [Tissierellia bacterium]